MGCCTNGAGMSCCAEPQIVQDKVCTPWNGTVDGAEVALNIFVSNMGPTLFGTGYIQYDEGPATITVNVLDGLGNTLNTSTMAPGTSMTFTYRRLGSIQLILPATDGTYQGEFCLTARYTV